MLSSFYYYMWSVLQLCFYYAFYPRVYVLSMSVVATTYWNGTCDMLTSAKLSVGYPVVGITKELDKKPLLHCSSIYINTMWSVLQQYLSALKASCPITYPPCFFLKTTMPYTCALTSYS